MRQILKKRKRLNPKEKKYLNYIYYLHKFDIFVRLNYDFFSLTDAVAAKGIKLLLTIKYTY